MKYLILLILLAGCATTGKFKDKCDSWIGQSEESLITAWGIPSRTYSIDENTKLLEYDGQNGVLVTGGGAFGIYCNTTFTSKFSVISSYRYQGNNCVSK